MKSEETRALYAEHTISCYGRSSGVVMQRGEGSWVWDSDGNKYLDFTSGIAVNNLGHCPSRINEVACEQVRLLVHTSNQFYNEPHGKLAKKLAEVSGLDRVFFSNSGAEANEAALKIARKWGNERLGGRNEIICYQNAFHGRTLGTISATRKEAMRAGYEPLLEGFVGVPAFDIDALARAITTRTVAIICEPIIGGPGVLCPPEGFLRQLRDLADQNNLLLIFDEMQSAIGRTGKMFAYQHYDIRPDILTMAKGLANGFPIGATVCTDR
ncbi:MAG: aminotransferase class III-fold pyridoxal phosphate-dependent enzyme, partial [Bdellovibrionales bacterium]|nr:aminotransferase class III-fold pyridoxal phosphate-dependent enzyme [Bdellovibrionales bacterium]